MPITAGRPPVGSGVAAARVAFACASLLAGLALALFSVVPEARAATLAETLADEVFVNEPGSTGRCTIYAATNMLRRAALLNGDQDWESITTSSIPSSRGLPFGFSVGTQGAAYAVEHGYVTGSTEEERSAELRALIDENPAGIVLYTSTGRPHAVTLLGYDEGTSSFTAHDSLTGATSSLDECVSVRVSNADAYWYVASPVSAPEPTSLRNATVTVGDAVYAGKAAVPQVEVALGGTPLVEGTDYAVSYVGNDAVGTALAVIVGMGDYSGAATSSFEVLDGAKALAGRCGPGVESSTPPGQRPAASRGPGAGALGLAA